MKRRLWIFVLAFAIAFVLFAASAFMARRQYAGLLATKVFPTGKLILPKLNATNPADILLLGDSRIADWNCSEIAGLRVVNAGFRGITSAQLAMSCRDILRQTHPKIVVIQAGINDLKLLGVRPDLRETITSNCVSNILTVIRESRQAGARVIFTPVWPAGKVGLMRRFVWSDAIDPAIAETNVRLLQALKTEKDVTVADVFGEMVQGFSVAQRNQLYSDTLHLKPETYARLSGLLAEKIRPMVQHGIN